MNLGWGDVLTNISPHAWGAMGIAIGLGFSVVGAAWYVSSIACFNRGWVHEMNDDIGHVGESS